MIHAVARDQAPAVVVILQHRRVPRAAEVIQAPWRHALQETRVPNDLNLLPVNICLALFREFFVNRAMMAVHSTSAELTYDDRLVRMHGCEHLLKAVVVCRLPSVILVDADDVNHHREPVVDRVILKHRADARDES